MRKTKFLILFLFLFIGLSLPIHSLFSMLAFELLWSKIQFVLLALDVVLVLFLLKVICRKNYKISTKQILLSLLFFLVNIIIQIILYIYIPQVDLSKLYD